MTKAFKLNWHLPVPKDLQEGAQVDRWTEDGDFESECIVKVDDCGFFIYWKSEQREGDVLELSQVNDIRPGKLPQDIRVLSTLKSKYGEDVLDQTLTVCSGLDMVNISLCHFVFPSKKVTEVWKSGLCSLTNNVKINNVCPKTNLEKHWKRLRMTTTVDGKVSVRAIAKTFASGKTEKLVYQTLAECDLPSGKNDSIEWESFTFDKFYRIYKIICPRTDIDDLFETITGKQCEEISIPKLIEFLNEKQRDPRLNEILYPHYNSQRVKEIIGAYEPDQALVQRGVISKEGLTNYLMSDENAPVFLDRLDIYQDMDQPLGHYYINSSHNTYLTGRQFGGKSSVEMYRQVLLAGCRCIELDCWDGKDAADNEPIITHGRAMCTEIFFKDVIYAIRDCAFVTSEYPLILSFENHCSRQQQYKMAKYCDEIFGDMLLKEPLPDYPLNPGVPLPPPSRLKRKILIKNKRLRPEVEKYELELFWKGELAIDEADELKEDASALLPPGSSNSSENRPPPLEGPSISTTSSSSASAAAAATPAAPTTGGSIQQQVTHTTYQGSTLNVHPYLSSMIAYTQPMKFLGFAVSDNENASFKMSSFPETTALGYLKTQAIEFVNYNKRQLSRIYPKGSRVDSSNFMPQIFWNSGCQLVSLNFQTPDLPMQLNQGKFEYNGNCGYLLKPDFMRRHDKQFDPFAETPVDGVIAAQCTVQVISGQFLSDKKVSTYVEVDMYGLPTDTIRKEYRTKVVPANGLNPIYNEEPFVFRKVVLPELAVLRFAVYDDNNKMLGQRILPFEDLQAGYRHIALRTEGNFPMSLPMLFCSIELKVYIPDGLSDFMDALSDPRAFLSNQEKRADQLKSLGVEESDILTDAVILSSNSSRKAIAGGGGSGGIGGGGGVGGLPPVAGLNKRPEEREEAKFEPITADSLKQEKAFVKVMKKHQKDLDAMRKRHQKDRSLMQKNQCLAFDKIVKGKGKDNGDVVHDPAVKTVVVDQTKQWSEMVTKQRKEELELRRQHLQVQEEVMKRLMKETQEQQIRDLEALFEKENKEMKAAQARASVETARDIQSDKTLKSKAEKERRLREKHSNNTKIFIDERKTAAMRQAKRREKIRKLHENQVNDLQKYIQASTDLYKNEEIEYQLAAKQECFV